MKRYATTKQKLDKSGIRVYNTTYYPEIPLENEDTFIYAVDGDRLDSLAHKYYGDTTLWWIIAKANELSKGDIAPRTDVKLRVPTVIDDILEAVQQSNS